MPWIHRSHRQCRCLHYAEYLDNPLHPQSSMTVMFVRRDSVNLVAGDASHSMSRRTVWVDAMYVIGALLLRIRLKQSRKARRDQRASIHHNATTIYWRARENLIYHYYIVLGVCILRRELTYDDDASHRPRKD